MLEPFSRLGCQILISPIWIFLFLGVLLLLRYLHSVLTQRKIAKEALRESEARFRSLTDVTMEGIIIHENGKVLDVNPAFARMFGYELNEVVGMSAEDFVTAESWLIVGEKVASGSEDPYQIIAVRKDGTTFPLEVIGRTYIYQGRSVRVASVRDLSNSQKAEEALIASEERFRATFNQAAVGMAHVSQDGKWLYVNQKLCDIVGYSKEELLTMTFQEITYAEDLDIDLEYVRKILAQEIQTYSMEKRYIRKDGSLVWINLTGSLVRDTANVTLRDRTGKPDYFIAVIEDISQRKQTELELSNRAKQQATIAHLGQRALSGIKLDSLMDETAILISETLEVEYCKILELLPDGKAFFLRSGIGWQPGLVGNKTIGARLDSQAGYTLICQEPVVVTDLRKENRFHEPQLLLQHGVISGMSVIIAGENQPWGVLGAHSRKPRIFTEDDINFFQAVANILAEAIARQQLLEKKQAARARAEENEQYYRLLTEAIPQIVWTTKPNGEIDYFNHRWYEYTGLSVEESLGSGWQTVLHPDDREFSRLCWLQAVETGNTYVVEYRLRSPDGSYRWYLGRGLPVRDRDGKIVRWLGTCTDIEDQKRAQSERTELLKREQAAKNIVQRLQAVTDVVLNHLSLEELLQDSLERISEICHADTAAILLKDTQSNNLKVRAVKGLEEEFRQEFCIPLGEGFAGKIAEKLQPMIIEKDAYNHVFSPVLQERKVQSLMGAPLIIAGRLLGVIHVGTLDIHEFTPEDLRLLELVADRIALAIDRANIYEAQREALNQAQEANRIKDEFLAIVSHELRTPLNSILGWAQMLRTRQLSQETINKALETIERNAKQQVNLIDDILDISRIIRGKIRLSIQLVNLAEVIDDVIETIKPATEAKSIQLVSILEPSVGLVAGDRSRLQQIVLNLLSNAVKFTSENGQIEIKLSVLEDRTNKYAQVQVRDTGKGIGTDFLPHVFEGFRQEDGSITRSHGGLGLGLTIVRRLVELHGGTVQAYSEGEGKGATFTVKLPLIKEHEKLNYLPSNNEYNLMEFSLSSSSLTVASASLLGLRILVVDDDIDNCELVANVLTQYGALVKIAFSAKEALNIIQKLKPDVLVSDLGMPGEDGYTLIRKIRELEASGGATICAVAIALSAFARDEDRRQAIQAGFQMHVPKPVEPENLAKVVATLVKHS
ncbi:PAS domain S-box protein [Aerosakkonemataceae cyanobacterium BLCC-F154]|uniref:histidine kinase n=1 Tax=Floridaenema fluviatile BLCC-F154 TaxID=3153640 RepID=A0ABV4YIE8_9CYAN